MKRLFRPLFLLVFVLLSIMLEAQNSISSTYSENSLIKGKEAFYDGRFNNAAALLEFYLDQPTAKPAHLDEAEYMLLVSNLYLGKSKAEKSLETYAKNAVNPYFSNLAYVQMGHFSQENGDYSDAAKYYKKVKEKSLTRTQKYEYHFKYGFTLLKINKPDEAFPHFKKVNNKANPYTEDALYYSGYIHYLNNDYQESQKYFDQVKNKNYKGAIEYYDLQFEFLEGDFANVQKKAGRLYNTKDKAYKGEIARILGHINYQNNDLQNAIDYYEVYQHNIEKLSREDIYLLGECYFALGEYKKAADAFTKVATLEDELSQNAYHKLAACYISLEDKPMARMAFESASRYAFNKEIQEEALFNYCKLTYELSYSPFNEIIEAFEKFTTLFPESEHTSEVYRLISEVFLNTNNYQRAYESLKDLPLSNSKLKQAFQRVTYYRAIELFNDLRFEEAIGFFGQSIDHGKANVKLKIQAHYWRGEAWFRLKNFDKALVDYLAFMQSPYSPKMPEFTMANYNLGYTYFKQNNPDLAAVWFERFIDLQKNQPDARLLDAYNRLADAYYLNRDFGKALDHYENAIAMGQPGSDYALYQKSFCLGLQKKYTDKIDALDDLIQQYKESTYIEKAWYEKGRTYTILSKNEQAIKSYQTLIKYYPESTLLPKALLNMALVYYNSGDEKKASVVYKDIVRNYRRTEEAQSALNALKTISLDNGTIDDYILYTKTIGQYAKLSSSEEDSLTYIAAEKIYMKGNLEYSKKYFANYIEKFPDGNYLLNAHYYKADCHLRLNETEKARVELEAIVAYPNNQHTEVSLARLASIYYKNKNYKKAETHYKRLSEIAKNEENILDGKAGLMRCYYYQNNAASTLTVSNQLLSDPKLSDELKREANYYAGKSYLQLEQNNKALAAFLSIANETSSAWGAEAKYHVCKLYYEANQPQKAIDQIEEFIELNTSHQYWLAKSFIVLANISIENNNDFEAKQYLQSVRDNYKGKDDVQQEVSRLIFEIDAREAQRYQARRDSLMNLLNDSSSQ